MSNGVVDKQTEIEATVLQLQSRLCLYHWRIRIERVDDEKLPRSLMRIKPCRDRHTAVIYIKDSVYTQTMEEIGPLLTHEMVHLVVDPLVEEHELQLKYTAPAQLEEYRIRFRQQLERLVERLALILADYYSPWDPTIDGSYPSSYQSVPN